jgi:transcriptional regulator with XRE-family HTH domain
VFSRLNDTKGGERVRYRIKELRESQNLTQTELAERAGIARATIWKLETGDDEITTTKTLSKIASVLGVGVNDLFLPVDV